MAVVDAVNMIFHYIRCAYATGVQYASGSVSVQSGQEFRATFYTPVLKIGSRSIPPSSSQSITRIPGYYGAVDVYRNKGI